MFSAMRRQKNAATCRNYRGVGLAGLSKRPIVVPQEDSNVLPKPMIRYIFLFNTSLVAPNMAPYHPNAFISSTSIQLRRELMPSERPAAAIDPSLSIASSRSALPGQGGHVAA